MLVILLCKHALYDFCLIFIDSDAIITTLLTELLQLCLVSLLCTRQLQFISKKEFSKNTFELPIKHCCSWYKSYGFFFLFLIMMYIFFAKRGCVIGLWFAQRYSRPLKCYFEALSAKSICFVCAILAFLCACCFCFLSEYLYETESYRR